MKKLINLLIISCLISCTNYKVSYFDPNYQEVFKVAGKQNKMVFIDFYTVWCGPCQFFEKNIKYDSTFKSFMDQYFYTIQIDAELEKNKEIVSKFNLDGYPTFIITNSNGEEIDRIGGLSEKTPSGFISLIDNILQGEEELGLLMDEYIHNPDSLELFRKIVIDKLLEKNLYNSVIEFSDFALSKSKGTSLIEEAKFWKAYATIKNPKIQSPKLMVNFVDKSQSEQWIEYGYCQLFYHYCFKNYPDSIKFYLEKLVKMESRNHLGYVRDFAEFLYTQNLDIEYANKLTKEYSESPGSEADHWTPYLNGHRLAKQGQLEIGIMNFDKWMEKYSKPENFTEDYWHYKFYIDFILYYKVANANAIKYAEKFEDENPNIENKQELAELYFYNRQNNEAVKKIKEIQIMVEDPEKKKEYGNLIIKYNEI